MIAGSVGSMAISETPRLASVSLSGPHEAPASVVFHIPPPGVPMKKTEGSDGCGRTTFTRPMPACGSLLSGGVYGQTGVHCATPPACGAAAVSVPPPSAARETEMLNTLHSRSTADVINFGNSRMDVRKKSGAHR